MHYAPVLESQIWSRARVWVLNEYVESISVALNGATPSDEFKNADYDKSKIVTVEIRKESQKRYQHGGRGVHEGFDVYLHNLHVPRG